MIKKKIVMIGSFAVGKTSLVQRFVNSIFSEKYQTTIGVKIDQKIVHISDTEVNLLLWDIHGEDDYQKIRPAYLIGTSGCFIVMDGTRKTTISIGIELIKTAKAAAPNSSIIILINKADIKDEWDVSTSDISTLISMGYEVIETSAKTGEGVEDAFVKLTKLMLK